MKVNKEPPVVLVTGGAGYIGSQTCKLLAQNGFLPVTIDSLITGHKWAVRWGPLEQLDVRDNARLCKIMLRYQPIAVVHFAAFIEVGDSVKDPAKFYDNNVVGTLSILSAMRATGVQTLIFSSTAAVYQVVSGTPITEETALLPTNPYGQTKVVSEMVIRDCCHAYGIKAGILRYFNAAGADPDSEIGEAHDPETHLIPLALMVAAQRRPALKIFGGDYPTPDGTCIRDYVHVADIAICHLRLLQDLEKREPGHFDIFNIGNGYGFSVREVIDTVERITGRDLHVEMASRRPGDPASLVADPGRASSVLGWKAQYPALDTQILHAWRWYQRYSLDSINYDRTSN